MKSPYFSSSSSSSSLSLTLFCLFFIMPGFPVSQSDPELYNEYEQGYERCHDALFECGDMQAGYPFFGGGRVKECGHRELKLLCDHRTNTTTINILGVIYRVLGIQHDRLILRISESEESVMNEVLCPLRFPGPDSILDFQVLTPGHNFTNVTLFLDCPLPPTNISSGLRVFPCLHEDYNPRNSVTVAIANNTHPEGCSANLTVSILQTSWEGVRNHSLELEQAFQTGFEVRWKEDKAACSNCNVSGGECGFGKEDQTVCYCPLGSWPPDYPKFSKCNHPPPQSPSKSPTQSPTGGKNSKSRNIELGIGLAGAAVILVGIGILLVWQQRRRKIAAQVISGELIPTSSSSKGLTNSSYYTSKCDEIERGSTYFGAHVFNYEELEEATDHFNPSKQLGEGGFGTVYYGVLKDGRVVAVKRLRENNLRRVDQYMNEIEILTLIRHPNLVTLYGCTSRRSRELLLVYEYIPNGTLGDHLHGKRSNSGSLTWNVRLSIALETVMALAYLHASDIIHRDVKSNNILLDNNFHVKVADFGLSRLFPTDVTHVSTAPQGTPGYVDPEYHQCYHLTEKSDVYSFGVVLIELISAKKAVDTNRNRHDINLANMAINRIENQGLPELVDPSLRFEHDYVVKNAVTAVAGLAFQCLQQERNMRPSMREVLQTLREIEEVRKEAEVLDIGSNDVKRLFKNTPPPPSPDYGTEKRVGVSTTTISNSF